MRMLKVNSEIKKLVSRIIDTELNNTNITGLITVQEVDTAADFSNAKIYVSMLGTENKKRALEALNKAKGYIRTRIAKELNFKNTPALQFYLDDFIEKEERIEKLIEQVSKEMKDRENKEKNKKEE